MKSFLIVCDNNPINLLLTNAVAQPLSKNNQVFLRCSDPYAPLFVNNKCFSGAGAEYEDKAYDTVAIVGDFGDIKSFYKGEQYLDYSTEAGKQYIAARTNQISIQRNLFQLFFAMMGLTWSGEGYNLHYFPRNRQKKNSLGISIRDTQLKEYII